VKYYDCGLIGNEFCVSRGPSHHYLIKFTIVNGEWVIGNKRNVIRIKVGGHYGKAKLTMTMGYYEEDPILKMKIREELLMRLMDCVSNQ
jgi:hypothetical protein